MLPDFAELSGLSADFSGVVRLFPLPNVVLFPHVMQPLHIFETRYREMLEEALSGDKLIAMALLLPGWQASYEGRPPIAPVVCLSRVVSHARQEDGRYNILLHGATRARVTRELPPSRSFRTAEVALLEDEYPASGAQERAVLQRQLLERFRSLVPKTVLVQEQFDQLLSHQVPLGILTDIASFALGLAVDFKQELLAECNVDRRATLLLERLASLTSGTATEKAGDKRTFPPEFSEN